MSDEMEPILLIASPQMSDPMFRETVVLVWQRDEEGAIGVVVNRSLEHRLLDVVEFDEEVDSERYGQTCISWGGPVEGTTGTVVTTEDIRSEEGWRLACGLSITRSHDALSRFVSSGAPFLLCLGYAGWGRGSWTENWPTAAGFGRTAHLNFSSPFLHLRATRWRWPHLVYRPIPSS